MSWLLFENMRTEFYRMLTYRHMDTQTPSTSNTSYLDGFE